MRQSDVDGGPGGDHQRDHQSWGTGDAELLGAVDEDGNALHDAFGVAFRVLAAELPGGQGHHPHQEQRRAGHRERTVPQTSAPGRGGRCGAGLSEDQPTRNQQGSGPGEGLRVAPH